ncbi:MAG: hypothetical protein ACTSQ7_00215 [Alphaproteobacteria bacterium]
MLRGGETVVRRLILAEGLTSHEIVVLVEQAEALEGGLVAAGNLSLRAR